MDLRHSRRMRMRTSSSLQTQKRLGVWRPRACSSKRSKTQQTTAHQSRTLFGACARIAEVDCSQHTASLVDAAWACIGGVSVGMQEPVRLAHKTSKSLQKVPTMTWATRANLLVLLLVCSCLNRRSLPARTLVASELSKPLKKRRRRSFAQVPFWAQLKIQVTLLFLVRFALLLSGPRGRSSVSS